jgi:hypothetical protein
MRRCSCTIIKHAVTTQEREDAKKRLEIHREAGFRHGVMVVEATLRPCPKESS